MWRALPALLARLIEYAYATVVSMYMLLSTGWNSIECQYPLLCTAQFYNSVLKCDLISHVVQIPFLVECNFYACVLLHLEL